MVPNIIIVIIIVIIIRITIIISSITMRQNMYGDNGKENGNYRDYRVILYFIWGYYGAQ